MSLELGITYCKKTNPLCVHSHFIAPLRLDGIVLLVSIDPKASNGRHVRLPAALGGGPRATEQSSGLGPELDGQKCPPDVSHMSAGDLEFLFHPDIEGVHAASDELSIDLHFHEHPGGIPAALTLVEEHCRMGKLHCQVHCREKQGNRKRLCL